MSTRIPDNMNQDLREANACLAWGAGLGTFSTATALLAGATCPLCLVIAPALLGVGAWKRYQIRQKTVKHSLTETRHCHPQRPDGQ